MTYTTSNMQNLLGNEASNIDAAIFAEFLSKKGWELDENEEGQVVPSRAGERMTDEQWQNALGECFDNLELPQISGDAAEIINDCLEHGYDWQDIADFLCDGEALAEADITDEDVVNEAYGFCQEIIKQSK